MQLTSRQQEILSIVMQQESISTSEMLEHLTETISIPTLNRELALLVAQNYLVKTGQGRSTAYTISTFYKIFAPWDVNHYFELEPDTRKAKTCFNPNIVSLLSETELFTPTEKEQLQTLKKQYLNNISDYPETLFQKELERLTIELSWKSAQIEGNTYSLLETERLFIEQEEAQGKPKEDATMLLNHKVALDYLLANPDREKTFSLRDIEEIHALLIKDLGVGKNIRSRTVGITGTAYKPLDNVYQIREAMEAICDLINQKSSGFEKALLAVVLISYIQPFEDGNKRTARMISNALLLAEGMCPLSYRSVSSLDYKKAILLFYEQNNLTAFKQIFIEQIAFSVSNYFQ